MSRIHEALQRAYLERGTAPVSGELQVVEPPIKSDFEEPPIVKAEVALENVAEHRWNPSTNSLPTLADRGMGVEQFRSLRSHVYQARYEAPLKTVLIASGMPSEGKSFIAVNLAISLARNSIHNILLIDADLRRPTLHDLLGAPNSPGLSDYLAGNADPIDVMQRAQAPKSGDDGVAGKIANLTFIASGGSRDNSSELVASSRMEELIASVSPNFDWIVIDAPPVLAVTDAVSLSRAADAVLLVARGANTPYEVAQRTKAAFGTSRILGFVLNAVKEAQGKGSNNYNYNYYYHADPEASVLDGQKKS
jgi:capsular exopolysaccharide synthesis family protein